MSRLTDNCSPNVKDSHPTAEPEVFGELSISVDYFIAFIHLERNAVGSKIRSVNWDV
jgi:hypothetical protein